MSTLWGVNKFAIEGENAHKVYEAVKESHFAKSHNALGFNTQIEFDYADGILRIEEHTDANSLVEELLCFFVGYDNFYSLTEYYEDGEVLDCELHNDEGKYFYNKNNTNYENLENN